MGGYVVLTAQDVQVYFDFMQDKQFGWQSLVNN
jgi:hypothetical protein